MKKKVFNLTLILVIFNVSVSCNSSEEDDFVSAEDINSEEDFVNSINELPPHFNKFITLKELEKEETQKKLEKEEKQKNLLAMLESTTDEEFDWEDEDSTNNYDSESGAELARSNNLQNSTSLKKNGHEGIKLNIDDVAAGIKEMNAFKNGKGTQKNVELHGSKRRENSGSQKDKNSLKGQGSFGSMNALLPASKSQKGLAGESQNSTTMMGSSTGSPTNGKIRLQHSDSQNGKSEQERRKIEEINDAFGIFEEYLKKG
uniref:Uncharacterized protein n=1 Tax=Meloidogyne enterolobii TaxID=390850 RepID=A0A6V7UMG2_MELEN|nr:unnamed protein product [Meloidogyne enterolobii]